MLQIVTTRHTALLQYTGQPNTCYMALILTFSLLERVLYLQLSSYDKSADTLHQMKTVAV